LVNGKIHAFHLGVGGKSVVKLSKREGDLDFFLFVWFRGDEEFSLSFIVELGSSKLTVLSFHDYFTGIFEPKILLR